MKMHKIAGLNVLLEYHGKILAHQAPAYETDEKCVPDIIIAIPEDFLEEKHKENPHLTLDECEYIFTGAAFYNKLVSFNGFLLHSSAVEYKGEAYLFSAPSGTGKSTHTGMWLEAFGSEARIINDDKPAIRVIDEKVFAYGTPWSGKTDLNLNVKVPVKGICFIERGEKNAIRRISVPEALALIFNQTVRPREQEGMDKLISCFDKVLSNINVYILTCNISKEAAIVAYEGMNKEE